MPVKIITDSSADLPPARAAELGVRVVPLTIRFGTEEFTDGVQLTPEQFYAKMAEVPDLPETAAPAPGAFEQAMREAAAEGGDGVVSINLSSALSATMASAENAARSIGDEFDVRVVDSLAITAALGMKVEAAAEAAAAGASVDEIVALVEEMRGRTRIYGALNTLDNLKKGGRIGGAQALLGSMLNIKPLIDISTGSVAEAGKARTRGKALTWLRDRLFEQPEVERVAVCSGCADDTDQLVDLIAPRYSGDRVQVWTIGPVIGAHGGPAVLGLAWHQAR